MNIVVKGRHCDVPERFQEQAIDKLAKLERFDHKVIRIDVEVTKEANPRRSDKAHRVELTVHSKGPVIRAEAAAEDRYTALDLATEKLTTRMRKAADRRREARTGGRRPMSLAEATANIGALDEPATAAGELPETTGDASSVAGDETARRLSVDGDGPPVVREKTHDAGPMTLDQALYEMELVGHDFFLYVDADSKQPSVVYRRKGYDYGVIHLNV